LLTPGLGETTVDINTIVEALAKLGLLDTFISRLSRDFDKVILWHRLTIGTDRMVSALEVDGDKIRVDGHVIDMSIEATLSAIQTVAKYLSTRLPHSIALPLSEKLVPTIASRLISNWLLPAIPLTVKDVPQFQETLSLVLGSAEFFDELGWSGQNRLREWVDKSAEIWLARRKQDAIARMHSLLPRRVREKKPVERVETQMVSHGDVLGRHEQEEDDWGADWENEEDHAAKDAPPPEEEVEEEDMSAWDDGDDAQEDAKGEPKPDRTAQHEEEDSDAWAWGDEDQPQTDVPQVPSKPKQGQPHSKEKAAAPQKSTVEKEVTLRETYTVTAVPDAIMEIILQVISDVGALNQPDLVASVIAPAAGGLYAIPSLLMAMYRATAASHYSKDVAGDMLIYNDCTRLADRLRSFLKERTELDQTSTLPQHLRPTARLKFDEDIKSIEGFGKRAYGREMESQRTIVKDHLGGAQSFQSCTAAPFAAECDNAIAMTIDRIGEVKRQWQNILSPSVLLQSLGSLVSTAISTFISDVEDMTDIAEDESRKLHSYCVSLSSLSSLFQQQDDSGAVQDMVSIYTPNWFKLQYLGEVLDSSLADIRYFWTNGELKLEMEAEEVVDLIKALFAESEHRRKAIAEIRRTSMH
jgi:centromere/kinetochore protein ZW10